MSNIMKEFYPEIFTPETFSLISNSNPINFVFNDNLDNGCPSHPIKKNKLARLEQNNLVISDSTNFYYNVFVKQNNNFYTYFLSDKKLIDGNYFYIIPFLGAFRKNVELIEIPYKIFLDVKKGKCKILLCNVNECESAYFYNLIIDNIKKFIKINCLHNKDIAYIDANCFNKFIFKHHFTALNSDYFFASLLLHKIKEDTSFPTSLINKTANCTKRFINLNSRQREHRNRLTKFIQENYDQKFHWSYTSQGKYLPGEKQLSCGDKIFNTSSHSRDAFIHVISETYYNCCFITEKTTKVIEQGQPFIVLGGKFSLAYLKSLGYKTFHPYIDETYDTASDSHRFDLIKKEISRLASLPQDKFVDLCSKLGEISLYNVIHHTSNIKNTKNKLSNTLENFLYEHE